MQQQTEVTQVPANGGVHGLMTKSGVQEDPSAIKLSVLKKSRAELETLYMRKQSAAEDFRDCVKEVAKQAGLLPSVVSKFIKACYEDETRIAAKKEADHLSLVFEEMSLP